MNQGGNTMGMFLNRETEEFERVVNSQIYVDKM